MEKKNIIKLFNKDNLLQHSKGITLIALIITVVIMLILATVSIDVINDGLFDYARKASEETVKAQDIQTISIIYLKVKGNSRTGTITLEEITNETNKYQDIKNVTEQEDHSFVIEFTNGNEYVLDQQGNVEEN